MWCHKGQRPHFERSRIKKRSRRVKGEEFPFVCKEWGKRKGLQVTGNKEKNPKTESKQKSRALGQKRTHAPNCLALGPKGRRCSQCNAKREAAGSPNCQKSHRRKGCLFRTGEGKKRSLLASGEKAKNFSTFCREQKDRPPQRERERALKKGKRAHFRTSRREEETLFFEKPGTRTLSPPIRIRRRDNSKTNWGEKALPQFVTLEGKTLLSLLHSKGQ